MTKKQLYIVLIFNLVIAVGFFFENLGVGFSELSSDSQNAIPICYKMDDNSLFKNDMYLNDLNNVKYYTPFYIQTVRFFAFLTNGDYILAINIFATLLHFLYGILWFYAFYLFIKKDFWVAFVLAIFVRGILWLPGFEIWGISDLWTIMPRTVYIVFLPIPFILLHNFSVKRFYLACFLSGFIFNFHPITGISGIMLFVSLVLGFLLYNKHYFSFKKLFISIVLLIIGMFPFVMTYFTKTDANVEYSLEDFNNAFKTRIPELFTNATLYMKQWLLPKTLFYLLPIIGLALLSIKKIKYRKTIVIIILCCFVIMFFPMISIPVENFINTTFNKNLRMSFQLVRAQKAVIIPGLIALGFLLHEITDYLSEKSKFILVMSFTLLVGISKSSLFDKVPFLSDDIARTVFPNWSQVFLSPKSKLNDLDKMALYIKDNTNKEALFYNDFILRTAAKRSVILDGKGASMLIEGNPEKFIQWYKDTKGLKMQKNFNDTIRFLKLKKVNYLILEDKRVSEKIEFIHAERNLHLFKIR